MVELCWKKIIITSTFTTRKPRKRPSAQGERLAAGRGAAGAGEAGAKGSATEARGGALPRSCRTTVTRPVRPRREAAARKTRPAASAVAPSTQKRKRNERVARKPPRAGPTLTPRLIA